MNESLRGGFRRPDPPVNTEYENKRYLSIYDINIWFYDHAMPEYALGYPEIHLETPMKAFLTACADVFPLVAYSIALYILARFLYYGRAGGEPEANSLLLQQVDQDVVNRAFTFKHFAGLCT